jgi:hypothetical protein
MPVVAKKLVTHHCANFLVRLELEMHVNIYIEEPATTSLSRTSLAHSGSAKVILLCDMRDMHGGSEQCCNR